MKLFDQIEYLRFDLIKNNDVDWDLIDELDFSPVDLEQSINKFLLGLRANHDLPGSDYYKLQGIAQWIHQYGDATSKQEKYALLTMAAYWDQLDLLKM